MASADEEVSKITDNKENSVHTEQHGIEANDLASLLHRFEEATSSSDDLSVPTRVAKNRKEILLRAKSAGSSPAATPPATPPPYGRISVSKGPGVSPQQPVLLQGGIKAHPIQLKFLLPPNASTTQSASSSTKNESRISALPVQILPASSSSTLLNQTSLLTRSAIPHTSAIRHPISGSVRLSVVTAPQLAKGKTSVLPGTIRAPVNIQASAPRVVVPKNSHSIFIQRPSAPDVRISSHGVLSSSSTAQVKTPTIVGLRNGPTATADTRKQKLTAIVPAPPHCVISQISGSAPLQAKPASVSTSGSLLTTTSTSSATTSANVSLLQSMLESQTPMNSQITSTQLSERLASQTGKVSADGVKLKGLNKSSVKSEVEPSVPAITIKAEQLSSAQSQKQGVSSASNSQDHDYCFLKMSTKDIVQQTARNIKGDSAISDVKSESMEVVSSSDLNTAAIEDMEEEKDEVPIESTTPQIPLSSEKVNEFVFEEGEFLIDEHGNDAIPSEDWIVPEHQGSQGEWNSARVVSFGGDDESNSRRRSRRYRRRAEFSTSPVREDTGNFFDKIPSYYTALSIPTKPTKTTVFASATRAIGTTDHLDFVDTSEQVDDGHYDKVPAHRRLFTNTIKEVEIQPEVSDSNVMSEDEEPSRSSQSRRSSSRTRRSLSRSRRSSSRHSHQSNSSHRARRSSSRHSAGHHPRHSRSRSPALSASGSRDRQSRSTSRRTRTMSRGSGRSSSSCSTCSSRSYCSTCSGSSSSRSRSRSGSGERFSRSGSSDSASSRSRSRSPGRQRDLDMRKKRSRAHFMPDRHGRRSCSRSDRRSRSRSRSNSSSRGQRWRSHRHRTRSRSSAERRISQKRKEREEEKIRAMEERRVVYVGKIPEGFTKRQLHKRFERFGEIKEVKVNFREHGDNYGFVTFTYACDAIAAKERGNNLPGEMKFDLCFGGRRRFCPDQYADLDGNREIEEEYAPMPTKMSEELDYAALLKQHSNQQRKKR
ncbi:platelet binding protein GspB [Aplysia californica]|uniref:Platelet binding protein GspB n=1 Tax=Aplysia californica TaxID=6500 RepID=A0ABM0JZK5_APLCA|nr:platelet binding protein GspB [Aplysia californica]